MHSHSYGDPFFIRFSYWKGARIALYCYNVEKEAGETSFPEKDIYVACPNSVNHQKSARQILQHTIDSCSLSGGGRVVVGKGVIDAQGGLEFANWSLHEAKDRDRLRKMGEQLTPVQKRIFGKGTILRPSCVQFLGCSRILIEEITIKNSPFWTIHPVYCDNVIVRGVTIDSHYPNNDGCDPESTSNVLIEDCTFKVNGMWVILFDNQSNEIAFNVKASEKSMNTLVSLNSIQASSS